MGISDDTEVVHDPLYGLFSHPQDIRKIGWVSTKFHKVVRPQL